MSKPWPPPPDLESLKELVRDADTEGFIELQDAPADEYDGEAEELYIKIAYSPTASIVVAQLLPHIEYIWKRAFEYSDEELLRARPKLKKLAQQIERFFGPEAKPQVR